MKVTLIILFICNIFYTNVFSQSNLGIKVTVNKRTGEYIISTSSISTNFEGSIGHSLTSIKNKEGHDSIGIFKEISFEWKNTIIYKAVIKYYSNKPIVLFSITLPNRSVYAPPPFPSFTTFPAYQYTFSYYDDVFAPPQFKLNETSTPWLFFDNSLNAFILSPASDFIVSKMSGDGKSIINSGFNPEIKNLPANFTHSTLLVIGKGIHSTWDEWGNTLRKLYKRVRTTNDADPVLKYFGYWTDNGADYYYNYDTTKGYAPTLVTLRNKYKEEKIPLGYLQLDSWWYDKSIYDVNGKPVADHKNPLLPLGRWNRYGGLMSYTADSFLFPKGLHSFQQQIDLPLVTHNRWVDPHSPYHTKYNIKGFAAIDPAYWNHIIQPISKAGVVCYEQDWLNYIYSRTPQMAEEISVGNAFTDGMANACKNAKLTMQYCMGMPRHFLQGLKYNNLTTIRTSDDRFEPSKWKSFLYTSQLAYEIGAWPWCDVFKSGEEGNMILSVLSAGPVGTGDAIGKENKENILRACRIDAVLVKPDVPILPIDKDYLNEAKNIDLPTLAYTYTKHNNITTGYLFAFTTSKDLNRNLNFIPATVGIKGKLVVFDPISKKISLIDAGNNFSDKLPDELYRYYILASVTSSGIAFFGDAGKIAATGKKRIADIRDEHNALQITVLFAKGESSVTLQGYSEKPVIADKGKLSFDTASHLFTLILPSGNLQRVIVNIKQKNN